MIATLDDLIAFSRRLDAESPPELRDSTVLKRPGLTPADITRLRSAIPSIPASYVSLVQNVAINGVLFGYFELSPRMGSKLALVDKLIEHNNLVAYPQAKRIHKDRAIHVANWEADPIAVVGSGGGAAEGHLLIYNAGNPHQPPSPLAESFEQFMLLAGALDEVRDCSEADGLAPSQAQFDKVLASLLDKSQVDAMAMWKQIAEVVLGK